MALTKLTTDLIDSTIVTSVNGSTGAVTLETGTDWQTTPKTADFTAVAGEVYFVNTTSAAITVTLPSSPNAGDEINLVDYAGTADTNNIIITSSNNINGASDDVLIDYERGGVSIVYVDATQGWIAYNAANETASALTPDLPLTVDYLVVAGGGGGGGGAFTNANGAGGGGAGGLRTSYGSTTGGGGSAESNLSLSVATNYTVTVGAGGNGGTTTSGATGGNNGSNSVFSTITSTGGGGGGGETDTVSGSGGSGGGLTSGGSGGSAVTSPVVQGFDGGTFNGAAGGGGGGATSVGADAPSLNNSGGAGGSGLTSSITGVSESYAGGGGGGGYNAAGGAGGTGGGGAGGQAQPEAGFDGTANTGGGGGGARSRDGARTGGDGGSGAVILRYPNTYTITIGSGLTGSTQTTGSDKVTTFTAGTGNITFS